VIGTPGRRRVAVVIPVFNERQSLPRVIEAIPRELAKTVVVVDNGSTDGTGAIARGLPVGGDLEYADEVTLGRALAGRREM